MDGNVVRSYESLRRQAARALRAKSTSTIIAQYHRGDPRRLYLFLHPSLWSIARLGVLKQGMLQVALPHAEDPEPIRALARAVDRRLREWLWAATGEMKGREKEIALQSAEGAPSLEQEILGSHLTAAI